MGTARRTWSCGLRPFSVRQTICQVVPTRCARYRRRHGSRDKARRYVPEASGLQQCRNWPHPKLFLESVQSPLTAAFRIVIAPIRIYVSNTIIKSTVCSILGLAPLFFFLLSRRPGDSCNGAKRTLTSRRRIISLVS